MGRNTGIKYMKPGTCIVFAQRCKLVQDGAIRQNNLQPKNSAVQRAIPKQTQTACICRYVPTDLATT